MNQDVHILEEMRKKVREKNQSEARATEILYSVFPEFDQILTNNPKYKKDWLESELKSLLDWLEWRQVY